MHLASLTHASYRNLVDGGLELAPGTTVLLGDNGQGKTSLLEAIGVLASTRSFRHARPSELARHGESSFALGGTVEGSLGSVRLGVSHREGRRTTTVNSAPSELADYIGHLTVVAITQAHGGIVRGSPQDRRDFLDRGLLGTRPTYLRSLASFRSSLRNKNALLRRPDVLMGMGRAHLAAWNERFAQDAAEVVIRRREYVRGLARVLAERGDALLPPDEPLRIALQDIVSRSQELAAQEASSGSLDRRRVAEVLHARMDELAEREAAAGQALIGPHRDDLTLELNGRDLRKYASSGQQRNALLALKVAKLDLFHHVRGEAPVLLVDDVDTEIDPRRLGAFLAQVRGRAQAVLSSSKPGLFGADGEDSRVVEVRAGTVTRARTRP